MKICFTIDQTYLHGGIERVLATKANYFAEVLQYDVYIITTHQNNQTPTYPFSNKIQHIDLGIPYNRTVSYFKWNNLKLVPKHYHQLKKVLRSLQPDVWIVCHFAVDFFFNPIIAKQLHIPVIKEYHGSAYTRLQDSTQQNWLTRLQLKIEKQYAALVLLNEGERAFYQHHNVVVIPNPQEPLPISADMKATKVLAAGRVAPIKNFSRLIDVWQHIHKKFPHWELHIWGPDYLNTIAQLQQKIKDVGLESVIHFKGATNDLAAEMDQYSIYAMSSDSECFPMVLLEALSAGMPSIAYDVPTGPKYIITNEVTGFLITNNDIDTYVDRLALLINDNTLRANMSEASKTKSAQYLPEAIMPKWVQLINDLRND